MPTTFRTYVQAKVFKYHVIKPKIQHSEPTSKRGRLYQLHQLFESNHIDLFWPLNIPQNTAQLFFAVRIKRQDLS